MQICLGVYVDLALTSLLKLNYSIKVSATYMQMCHVCAVCSNVEESHM